MGSSYFDLRDPLRAEITVLTSTLRTFFTISAEFLLRDGYF